MLILTRSDDFDVFKRYDKLYNSGVDTRDVLALAQAVVCCAVSGVATDIGKDSVTVVLTSNS